MDQEQVLEEVESFCYLGSLVDRSGGTEAEVKSRAGNAQAAFASHGKVFENQGYLSKKRKLKLFNSNVK